MKQWLVISIVFQTLATADHASPLPPRPPLLPEEGVAQALPKEQFVSTVQIFIKETDPLLQRRSQKLVLQELTESIKLRPELQDSPYQIRTSGNEVTFYLVTNKDMRQPMQTAVGYMIEQLNGRVRARGRSHYYRTSLEQNQGGFLDIRLSQDHTKISSIAAQSVPLRELLRELKAQLGELSYLIPGECAGKLVEWSFGEHPPAIPKSVDQFMSELAVLFGLQCEKKNSTYIFTGQCSDVSPSGKKALTAPSPDYIAGQLFPQDAMAARPTQVYFPVLPMGGD